MAEQSKRNDANSKTGLENSAFERDEASYGSTLQYNSTPITSEDERNKTRRSFIAQALACSAKNLVLFSYGMALGFITIAIPELSSGEDGFKLTPEQISWFGSSNWICVSVGGVISGSISAPFGRRPAMIFVNIIFIISAFLFHFASSLPMLYVAQSLGGIAGGLLEAPCLTYIGEITEPHLRGALSSSTTVVLIMGILADFILGSVLNWRIVALINVTAPICAIISLLLVPESPHWLMIRGREEASEKSLRWLRGWVGPEEVREELNLLRQTLLAESKKKGLFRGFSPKDLLKRTFLLPYSLCAFSYFVGHWGGMTPLQTFAVPIFQQLGSPINAYTATILIGFFEVLGGFGCVGLVHYVGKRKLLIVSMIGCALCFLATAIWSASKNKMIYMVVDDSMSAYTPVVFLVASAFFSHLMIRILPWVLIGEIYPPEVKGFASGASGATGYLLGFSANKSFIGLSEMLSLPGTFFLYAIVGGIGVVVLYFVLPETEGRQLHEILTFFDGTGSIKERGMPREKKQSTNSVGIENPTKVDTSF